MSASRRLSRPVAALALVTLAAAPLCAATPVFRRDTVAEISFLDSTGLAQGHFYVSRDGGATWTKAAEVAAVPNQKLSWTFQAPSDGSYLIKTVAIPVAGRGAPEPAPAPGTIPPNATHLIIDTTAPVVERFTASFAEAQRTSAGLTLVLAWTVRETNPPADPVELQQSSDGGATWTTLERGALSGERRRPFALADSQNAVQLRVVSADLADNRTIAAALTVTAPPRPDPTIELTRAVSALPDLASLGVAPKPPSAAPATASASTTQVAQRPSPPPPEPGEIVAPNAPRGSVEAAPVGPDVVTGATLDEAYYAATRRPSPGKAAVHGQGDAPAAAPARVPIAAATLPVSAPAGTPFITGADAEAVLDLARAEAKSGDVLAACALFVRLQESDQAVVAIEDHLALLRAHGASDAIIALTGALPLAYQTDAVRIESGRAFAQQNRHGDAITVLSRVSVRSPRSREAMLILARSLRAEGRTAEAGRLFARVAEGNDALAEQARSETGGK